MGNLQIDLTAEQEIELTGKLDDLIAVKFGAPEVPTDLPEPVRKKWGRLGYLIIDAFLDGEAFFGLVNKAENTHSVVSDAKRLNDLKGCLQKSRNHIDSLSRSAFKKLSDETSRQKPKYQTKIEKTIDESSFLKLDAISQFVRASERIEAAIAETEKFVVDSLHRGKRRSRLSRYAVIESCRMVWKNRAGVDPKLRSKEFAHFIADVFKALEIDREPEGVLKAYKEWRETGK